MIKPAHWCTLKRLGPYFALHTKHSLTYNMAACTRWPWIDNLVTSVHSIHWFPIHQSVWVVWLQAYNSGHQYGRSQGVQVVCVPISPTVVNVSFYHRQHRQHHHHHHHVNLVWRCSSVSQQRLIISNLKYILGHRVIHQKSNYQKTSKTDVANRLCWNVSRSGCGEW